VNQKITFTIQLTKIVILSPWPQFVGHRNIYPLFYGKHMLLMAVVGLLNIIFIRVMFLVVGWFSFSVHLWLRLPALIVGRSKSMAKNLLGSILKL
jgi:hypothetical protein